MTLASILMVVAIAAAALGFSGFQTGLCYAIFYATLGFLGVHILLNAIDEDAREAKAREAQTQMPTTSTAMPNQLANS